MPDSLKPSEWYLGPLMSPGRLYLIKGRVCKVDADVYQIMGACVSILLKSLLCQCALTLLASCRHDTTAVQAPLRCQNEDSATPVKL